MTVLTFAQPYWLLLLVFVPLVIWRGWRALDSQSAAVRFSSLHLLEGAPQTWRVRLRPLPVVLRGVAIALAIVAMARPQERNVYVEHTSEGIDIMLVLDTSTSMRARDFHPNRFEAARDVAAEFVRNRTSDRVGLVVFAGKAFTQAPLTIDYQFLLRMLGEVQIGVVEDGTAIGNALAMAVARLRESDAASRVVILLTDGQNNRGEIDPVTAAELARTLGSRVYTVGVGRVSGASDHDPWQSRRHAQAACTRLAWAALAVRLTTRLSSCATPRCPRPLKSTSPRCGTSRSRPAGNISTREAKRRSGRFTRKSTGSRNPRLNNTSA